MPHYLVFGLTLEMTAFGGSRTLLRGPGATGWAVYTKKYHNNWQAHRDASVDAPLPCFWFNSKGQHQNAWRVASKKNFKHVSVAFSLNTICQNTFPSPIRSQCDGNVFWQISFPPKAMGTCFGDGNVFWQIQTGENATGTHLQKRIFRAFKGLLWPWWGMY